MSDYANVLQEGQDLVAAAGANRTTYFRESEIQAVIAALMQKRSVLLVGPAGVGKTAVVRGVVRRMAVESAQGFRTFTTSQIMAGTRWIGEWQSKLTRLLKDSEEAGVILNVVDIWNLSTAGNTSQSKECFLDAMRPPIADGRLRVVSEVTADQLQEMYRVPQFAALFELIHIEPLSDQQIRGIVDNEAVRCELAFDEGARERLFQLCETFSPGDTGPGPLLDLLRKVRDYRDQKLAAGEDADLTPLFVEKVFAIHSGLPVFVVSRTESKSATEIRDWFRERIIGQEAAIEAVVEMIAFYKARLHDTRKPIGTFLFVGPTGVGKTELARALAEFFFGSERRMLRFDMSEFADYNAFEMLIGSPKSTPDRRARLLDPVRLQPFQVLLFDELEKAHRNIQDLFLQLLDEGRLTTPQGETVSFRSAIIIATSNVGAFEGMVSAIGFGGSQTAYDQDKALAAIETHFRPEFLNRFQHVVLFHPLTHEQAVRIARIDLQSVLKREGIAGQNLIVDVHDDVIDHVLATGFNPRYGGRAIKREIKRQIILPLATLLMERSLAPGTLIEIGVEESRVRIRVADTPEARHSRAESAALRTGTGERLTRKQLKDRIGAARAACEVLVDARDLSKLRDEIEKIDADRKDYTFWRDPEEAARILARQTRSLETLTRIERLKDALDELAGGFELRATRSNLERLAASLLRLESAMTGAVRELVAMGSDGYWDALMEITPIGRKDARDFLFGLYSDWAKERRLEIVLLREPMASNEAIAVLVKGSFAHGYLKGETGHHRLRRARESSVARVRVAPLSDRAAAVEFGEQRPLKAVGQLAGKIRSRVAVLGTSLVLQNSRTLAENRELALDVGPSWPREQIPTMPTVRRYDLSPFLVRDYLTKTDFTRGEILGPKLFHHLLCARIDQSFGTDEGDTESVSQE
jgi:ATP-dependent Clp protease ATP-binding subunit ClpC